METCLIVDESSVVRKVATRILFQLGLTVQNAGSGAEALELLKSVEMPDLVIIAQTLPDMTGEALVRQVRERPGGKRAIVMAALVEANLGQMTRLKRASANGFIYKPFDRKSLLGWLEPYIQTRLPDEGLAERRAG